MRLREERELRNYATMIPVKIIKIGVTIGILFWMWNPWNLSVVKN
jgi:hypothetical protein